MGEKIEKADVERRRARLTQIFSDIVEYAATQSLSRCPYRDRRDLCTARFGCRNQGPLDPEHGLQACLCEGQLDYRSAWETEDPEAVLELLRARPGEPGEPKEAPSLRAGAVSCDASPGLTLFDLADQHGVRVDSSCGRMASCHECVVEVIEGAGELTEVGSEEEFLQEGFRLACQARCTTDGRVTFAPLRRAPHVLTDHLEGVVELAPSVERVGEEVHRDGEKIDEWRGGLLGLAVDVGTTTVATELVDLLTGKSLCRGGFENPQRFGGSDVISRISYDAGPFRGELHSSLIAALNNEILALCRQVDVSRHTLYDIVVVGNATMRDLLFGLDVQTIGQRPYKSSVEHEMLAGERVDTTLCETARSLGMIASAHGLVYSPPLVASHIGSDVAAGLLAVGIGGAGNGAGERAGDDEGATVYMDIGTNTEVVVATRGRIVVASCPAGPAFEGGLVRYGVPACDGAIDAIHAVGDAFEYTTLGETDAVGLCGSGLIDLLAELRRTGRMTEMGVFSDKAREIQILEQPPLGLSREDASHLAQAKAASYCGQFILLRQLGLDPGKVQRVCLAGGFAHSIDVDSAIAIGFLAPFDPDRVVRVGNAALDGARQLLVDARLRGELLERVARIEHVELETTEDFFEIFVEACQFKPMAL